MFHMWRRLHRYCTINTAMPCLCSPNTRGNYRRNTVSIFQRCLFWMLLRAFFYGIPLLNNYKSIFPYSSLWLIRITLPAIFVMIVAYKSLQTGKAGLSHALVMYASIASLIGAKPKWMRCVQSSVAL